MNVSRAVVFATVLSILLIAATPDIGWTSGADTETTTTPRNVISTNPLLDLYTWFNAEYELRMVPNGTVGIAGSYVSLDDDNDTYKSAHVFYRFYPQSLAPAGFFIGGRLGAHFVTNKVENGKDETGTAFGVGIDIGYTWLMGSTQSFALSLGIGAVRLFGGDLEDIAMTLPTVRLVNFGIAF